MPRRNDIAQTLIICFVFALFTLCVFAGLSQACTIAVTPVIAASNFDLLVQDHGQPVAGIRIVVSRIGDKSRKRLAEGTSDSEGKVPIRGLLPGEYSIDNLGAIQPPGLVAIVKKSGPTSLSKPIIFQWPWLGIAKTRRLQGAFLSANPNSPFEELDLSVLKAGEGTLLKTSHLGPDGRFDFADLPPGLYVIQVHAKQPRSLKGWEVEGPIAVEVTQESSGPANLDLALGETSCGIWYAQCAKRETIRLASRQVQISDLDGAVIGSAQFTLEDESGKMAVDGQSSRQGIIDLPENISGSYKLKVYSPGFTPLEQPLELLPHQAGSSPLRALLNIGGTCSQASLETHATP
jgi:hypothetical protein